MLKTAQERSGGGQRPYIGFGKGGSPEETLAGLDVRIIACRHCPRLVAWREAVAQSKTRRFRDQEYWGKPIVGFGDFDARVVLVGLAPAAHGGNRTGRMFTGDESGNWLFRALYETGFANQPESIGRADGLRLKDCYITASVRCAPPQNKPTKEEFANCRPYLLEELSLLKNLRVVVGLGKIGFDAAASALKELGLIDYRKKPKFGHGIHLRFGKIHLLGTYHPSQQNTFTKKLTREMLRSVFRKARSTARRK